MCVGNRATSSAYYINQQLATLWQLSKDCVDKHGYGIKASKAEVEYGSCLAQVCVGRHNRSKPSKEDLDFFAYFSAAPQLIFICNHEAVLQFQLGSGHYRIGGKNSLETIENYTCSFRLQFREQLITETSFTTFGQTDTCKAKLLILDLTSATFLRETSGFSPECKLGFEEIDRHHRLINQYLFKHYLPLLRKAGIHCLYSLPDFSNLSRSHHIDYSVVSETDIEVTDIFGINIETINTFMASRWLEAASCIDELEDDYDHTLNGQYVIAEHRGVCEDIAFHAFFGAPRLRAVCSKEVFLYIDVHELHFYLQGDFDSEVTHKVSDWTIAIAVEVSLVEEQGGLIRNLKLDFTKARFCERRSVFHSETIEEKILLRLRTVFVQYLIQRYLFILEEFQHNQVYRIDVRAVEVVEEIDIEEEEEYAVIDISTEFRERVAITDTFGFDLMTAITQGSLNNHLRGLWKASQSGSSCLTSWAFDDFFSATFGPLQVQFPYDARSNTVTLYITLREGFLTTLGRGKKTVGGEKHEFLNWRLAFDLTLRAIDYTKAHATSDTTLSHFEGIGKYTLKQLVLDFTTAKFRQDQSRLPGLFDRSNYRHTRSKREALLYYIVQYYFAELQEEGHHVLYSIPIWKGGNNESFRYAASSLSFQFYGFPTASGGGDEYVSGLFGGHGSHGDRNMLVICGTMDQSRRPSFPLPRCPWGISVDREVFSGTIVLSRTIFLEGWLLKELSRINGRTTLVPIVQGINDGGDWQIELVGWNKHPQTHDKECNWTQIQQCEESLEFEWKNSDEWTYAHYGDVSDVHNGGYTVSCTTTNKAYIPLVTRNGVCEVRLTGKIDLKLSFSGARKGWSTSASARWYATITISGDRRNGGIKIIPSGEVEISDHSGFEGSFDIVHREFKDASTLLREQLTNITLIEEGTLHELDAIFAGVWPLFFSGFYGYTLTNPVFNSNGDLRLDLLSPIDRQGGIIGEKRPDIYLPSGVKTRSVSDSSFLRKNVLRESSFGETSFGENSFYSSASIDTPLNTPPPNVLTFSAQRGGKTGGNSYFGDGVGLRSGVEVRSGGERVEVRSGGERVVEKVVEVVNGGHETPRSHRPLKISDLGHIESRTPSTPAITMTTVRRGQ